MWKIAKKYGVDFKELLRLNSQIKTPDTIYPGARIKIPAKRVPVRPQDRQTPHPMSEAPYVKERPITEEEGPEVPQEIERRPIEPEEEEEVQIESEEHARRPALPPTAPVKEMPEASPTPSVSPEMLRPALPQPTRPMAPPPTPPYVPPNINRGPQSIQPPIPPTVPPTRVSPYIYQQPVPPNQGYPNLPPVPPTQISPMPMPRPPAFVCPPCPPVQIQPTRPPGQVLPWQHMQPPMQPPMPPMKPPTQVRPMPPMRPPSQVRPMQPMKPPTQVRPMPPMRPPSQVRPMPPMKPPTQVRPMPPMKPPSQPSKVSPSQQARPSRPTPCPPGTAPLRRPGYPSNPFAGPGQMPPQVSPFMMPMPFPPMPMPFPPMPMPFPPLMPFPPMPMPCPPTRFPPMPRPCPPAPIKRHRARRPICPEKVESSSSSCDCPPDDERSEKRYGKYNTSRGPQPFRNNMMFPPSPCMSSMPEKGVWPNWGDGHDESSAY